MGLIEEVDSERGRSRNYSELTFVFCISKL